MTGAIVRLMMLQFPAPIGTTGWMLSTLAMSPCGPIPKYVLFCRGRLIIAATGFCAALARAPLSWACEAVACARMRATSGTATTARSPPDCLGRRRPCTGTASGRHDVEPELEGVEVG